MRMLELRRISKSYGQGTAEVHALREVSLSADDGAMIAVMGPSGSGKTEKPPSVAPVTATSVPAA